MFFVNCAPKRFLYLLVSCSINPCFLLLWRHAFQEPHMTITIDLPPATLTLLQAEAQASGKDVETFVKEAIEAKLHRRKRTFAEILKPFHDAVEAGGLSEEEITSLLEQELQAYRNA